MLNPIQLRLEWCKTLQPGDKIIYEISQTFDWENTYFEDLVKKRVDEDTIITEAGLKFLDYQCKRNWRILTIENPNTDYDENGKSKIHRFYQESKNKGNVVSINDWLPINRISSQEEQLNAALKRIWTKNKQSVTGSIIDDAYLEKSYREINSKKIDYFSTLAETLGFQVVNGSLINSTKNNVIAKRCSFKIGSYLVYRILFNEKKKDHWEESLIYVYNTKTNELRQDMLGFITNTRYWLEMEQKDINPDHTSKLLNFPLVNIAHKINTFKKKHMK
ncbi:hypothetical protein IAQ67_16480 [Paenibacillus peoriae]|uniref:Uncharacterized protein n=1 Tax=Paenibacillus peoriae TaxID=59893 RepID=A0A7H0Y325_9BACL|nr:hypothetical protein [Paenibacillus peoriae]QNR65483.1 hypothetical protein IAQ67_16480 [Paenibacillus peoriae]